MHLGVSDLGRRATNNERRMEVGGSGGSPYIVSLSYTSHFVRVILAQGPCESSHLPGGEPLFI